jgi:hypothetical protein
MSTGPVTIGRYQVRDRLGQGGMGVLYLALDPAIDRLVALKVLRVDNEEMRERFLREARLAARLQHPNIVTIYDVGSHEGQPFIAMEYISGETLAELIQRRASLAVERKLEFMLDACQGLAYAHRHGIIHRDIKPANLMVGRDAGVLKVLDFGIARGADSTLTQIGMLMGTPNYMSPEQIEGRPIDQRSDIFAIGLVFYELLAYRQAFRADTPHAVLHAVLHSSPTALSQIAPDLDRGVGPIVDRAIAKDVSQRYQDLEHMRSDLQKVVARLKTERDQPTTVTPVPGSLHEHHETPHTPKRTPPPSADLARLAERRAAQIQTHLQAAEQALGTGELEAAMAAAESAALLDQEDVRVMRMFDRIRAATDAREVANLLGLARQHLTQGLLTEASQAVQQALQIDNGQREAQQLKVTIERALEEREQQRRREAAAKRALQRVEECVQAGAYEGALRAIAEATGYDPANTELQAARERVLVLIDQRANEEIASARAEAASGQHDRALQRLMAFAPWHTAVDQETRALQAQIAEIQRVEHERRQREAEEARRIAEEQARREAEEARLRAEAEARKKAEEEAARKAEDERRRKAYEEARRKVEEEKRLRAEAAARKKAEEAAKKKAAEEAEAARLAAEAEARRKAEEEAKQRAAEEARQRAEAEARQRAEQEARQRAAAAAEQARQQAAAEEAQRKAAAEAAARQRAEQEARQRAEEAARKKAADDAQRQAAAAAAEDARKKAAAEDAQRQAAAARQRAEQDARKKAADEAQRQAAAEQARQKAAADAAARQRAEQEARKKAAEDAQRQAAAEQARQKAAADAAARKKADDAQRAAAAAAAEDARRKGAAAAAEQARQRAIASAGAADEATVVVPVLARPPQKPGASTPATPAATARPQAKAQPAAGQAIPTQRIVVSPPPVPPPTPAVAVPPRVAPSAATDDEAFRKKLYIAAAVAAIILIVILLGALIFRRTPSDTGSLQPKGGTGAEVAKDANANAGKNSPAPPKPENKETPAPNPPTPDTGKETGKDAGKTEPTPPSPTIDTAKLAQVINHSREHLRRHQRNDALKAITEGIAQFPQDKTLPGLLTDLVAMSRNDAGKTRTDALNAQAPTRADAEFKAADTAYRDADAMKDMHPDEAVRSFLRSEDLFNKAIARANAVAQGPPPNQPQPPRPEPPKPEPPKPEPQQPVNKTPDQTPPYRPPSPQPQQPTPAPVNEKPAITATLQRLSAAYETLDVGQVAAVWPTMSGDRQRSLRDAFNTASAYVTTLSNCAIDDSRATQGQAVATCDVTRRVTYKAQGPMQFRMRGTYHLQKKNGGWIITDVTEQRM